MFIRSGGSGVCDRRVAGSCGGVAAGTAVWSQSQEQLRGYARRAEESVHELVDEATDVVGEALDKGREFIKDKQAVLSEAVEAGRTAMHRERERPSAEKKA